MGTVAVLMGCVMRQDKLLAAGNPPHPASHDHTHVLDRIFKKMDNLACEGYGEREHQTVIVCLDSARKIQHPQRKADQFIKRWLTMLSADYSKAEPLWKRGSAKSHEEKGDERIAQVKSE